MTPTHGARISGRPLSSAKAAIGLATMSIFAGACPGGDCNPTPTPPPTSSTPPTVASGELSFSSMRGANIFSPSAVPLWFGQATELQDLPEQLNLNAVRLPVDLADAVYSHTESQLAQQVRATLDVLASHNQKAIVLLAGYTFYDRQQPQDPYPAFLSFLEVQEAAETLVEELKGHPALFAWELMNEATPSSKALFCNDPADPDVASVNQAVHAMYDLVHELDPERVNAFETVDS